MTVETARILRVSERPEQPVPLLASSPRSHHATRTGNANLELLEASFAARGADAEEEEIVAGALGSSRRMRRLVADLLLLARADAGRTGPRRTCDLAAIAEAAVAEVRPLSDGHLLELDAEGPVAVEGNPDDLHRLVVNLVENGVRHTPAGCRVSVSVRASDDGEAVLEVCDDGPGLPEGIGDQIFARFVRGNGPADLATDSGTGPRAGDRQGGRRVAQRAGRGRPRGRGRGPVRGRPAARRARQSPAGTF